MIKKLGENHIYMQLPYEAKERVKDLLNGTWSKKEKAWKFPKNVHVLRELLDYFAHLKNDSTFMATYEQMKKNRLAFLQTKVSNEVIDPRLREYQNQDVNYLKKLPAAGVFNEQRTGKSPTTITLLREIQSESTLIVCPASLLLNWKKEFETWNPNVSVFIMSGTPKKRTQLLNEFVNTTHNKCLIVSKDTLKAEVGKLEKMEFTTMVVDESHFLRNMKSLQSQAIYKMGLRCKRRYALSGTPTVTHDSEIFGILHFLYPEKFSSYWQFVARYFEMNEQYWGGKEIGEVKPHRKHELEELISLVSVQRKRKDIMTFLPDKTYQTIPVEMSSKQQKLYDMMVNDFLAVDEETGHEVDTATVLAQLTRSRQICLDPRLLGFDVVGEKTKTILEEIENTNEPIIIMSMFTSYLKLLAEDMTGKRVAFIHGEMSAKEKQKSVDDFQQGKIDVLLCNIISAGTGFTLDKGEQIWFTDLPWNPSDWEQAQDRIISTTEQNIHKAHIITFECHNTVDERINDILRQKKSLTEVVSQGGENAIRRLLK